ncbi:MAG: hypothetical protein AAB267_00990, partial [Candidatus Desantisbacteria bacterium]
FSQTNLGDSLDQKNLTYDILGRITGGTFKSWDKKESKYQEVTKTNMAYYANGLLASYTEYSKNKEGKPVNTNVWNIQYDYFGQEISRQVSGQMEQKGKTIYFKGTITTTINYDEKTGLIKEKTTHENLKYEQKKSGWVFFAFLGAIVMAIGMAIAGVFTMGLTWVLAFKLLLLGMAFGAVIGAAVAGVMKLFGWDGYTIGSTSEKITQNTYTFGKAGRVDAEKVLKDEFHAIWSFWRVAELVISITVGIIVGIVLAPLGPLGAVIAGFFTAFTQWAMDDFKGSIIDYYGIKDIVKSVLLWFASYVIKNISDAIVKAMEAGKTVANTTYKVINAISSFTRAIPATFIAITAALFYTLIKGLVTGDFRLDSVAFAILAAGVFTDFLRHFFGLGVSPERLKYLGKTGGYDRFRVIPSKDIIATIWQKMLKGLQTIHNITFGSKYEQFSFEGKMAHLQPGEPLSFTIFKKNLDAITFQVKDLFILARKVFKEVMLTFASSKMQENINNKRTSDKPLNTGGSIFPWVFLQGFILIDIIEIPKPDKYLETKEPSATRRDEGGATLKNMILGGEGFKLNRYVFDPFGSVGRVFVNIALTKISVESKDKETGQEKGWVSVLRGVVLDAFDSLARILNMPVYIEYIAAKKGYYKDDNCTVSNDGLIFTKNKPNEKGTFDYIEFGPSGMFKEEMKNNIKTFDLRPANAEEKAKFAGVAYIGTLRSEKDGKEESYILFGKNWFQIATITAGEYKGFMISSRLGDAGDAKGVLEQRIQAFVNSQAQWIEDQKEECLKMLPALITELQKAGHKNSENLYFIIGSEDIKDPATVMTIRAVNILGYNVMQSILIKDDKTSKDTIRYVIKVIGYKYIYTPEKDRTGKWFKGYGLSIERYDIKDGTIITEVRKPLQQQPSQVTGRPETAGPGLTDFTQQQEETVSQTVSTESTGSRAPPAAQEEKRRIIKILEGSISSTSQSKIIVFSDGSTENISIDYKHKDNGDTEVTSRAIGIYLADSPIAYTVSRDGKIEKLNNVRDGDIIKVMDTDGKRFNIFVSYGGNFDILPADLNIAPVKSSWIWLRNRIASDIRRISPYFRMASIDKIFAISETTGETRYLVYGKDSLGKEFILEGNPSARWQSSEAMHIFTSDPVTHVRKYISYNILKVLKTEWSGIISGMPPDIRNGIAIDFSESNIEDISLVRNISKPEDSQYIIKYKGLTNSAIYIPGKMLQAGDTTYIINYIKKDNTRNETLITKIQNTSDRNIRLISGYVALKGDTDSDTRFVNITTPIRMIGDVIQWQELGEGTKVAGVRFDTNSDRQETFEYIVKDKMLGIPGAVQASQKGKWGDIKKSITEQGLINIARELSVNDDQEVTIERLAYSGVEGVFERISWGDKARFESSVRIMGNYVFKVYNLFDYDRAGNLASIVSYNESGKEVILTAFTKNKFEAMLNARNIKGLNIAESYTAQDQRKAAIKYELVSNWIFNAYGASDEVIYSAKMPLPLIEATPLQKKT